MPVTVHRMGGMKDNLDYVAQNHKLHILVGFPRNGILLVLCHFFKNLCLTAVAKPNLLGHFFNCSE